MNKWLGDFSATKETLFVLVVMSPLIALYELSGLQFVEGFTFNWWEFIGTLTGTACVWLVRTKNIQNWPLSIICAATFGYFFMQINLAGQQWLNWAFFLPISVWCWWEWSRSVTTTSQDLPVTTLSFFERALYLVLMAVATVLLSAYIVYLVPWSQMPVIDSTVVVASVVAQYFLGKRKFESWLLWLGPVNMLSIYLFYSMGAYTTMVLYIAYFFHAAIASYTWHRQTLVLA
jgi:nicotinamide mononucleotide transporter